MCKAESVRGLLKVQYHKNCHTDIEIGPIIMFVTVTEPLAEGHTCFIPHYIIFYVFHWMKYRVCISSHIPKIVNNSLHKTCMMYRIIYT